MNIQQTSLPRYKVIVYSLVITVGLFFFLETGVRVGASLLYGFSPYYLFYGIKSQMADADPKGHTAAFDGYFKFPPSQTLHQYGMFTTPTPIRINSLGFRGKDFSSEKPENLYRIICMGGSSTFGFFDRDEYTYPAILGRLFKTRVKNHNIEVINAGIPHANSENLLAMLQGEVLDYKPDMITIYTGYNDASYAVDENALQKLARWLHAHSAIYVVMKRALTVMGGPVLHSKWAGYLPRADREHIRQQTELHVERYRRNLEEILTLAKRANIHVIFIKQPVTTTWQSSTSRLERMNYQSELDWIRHRLEQDGWVTAYEALFLIHNALMKTLEEIADKEGVTIVDNIAIVNDQPDYLASYVHVTEEGNMALAEALYLKLAFLVLG